MATWLFIPQAKGELPDTSVVFSESFESPGGGQGTVAGYPTGWLAANLNWWGVYNPLASLYLDFTDDLLPTPAQGSQVLWIQSYNYVARFLTNTLIAGQTYTLSGVIGNRADGYGIQLPTDQEYVYLFAGNTLLAKNVNLPHPAPGHFLPWSISYTAPASDPPSGPLEIRLGQYGAGQVHFDNLSLTAGKTLPPIVAAAPSPLLFKESFESPGREQGIVAGVPDGWLAANLNWWGVYNPLASLYLDFTDDLLPTPAQGSQVLWIQSYNYVARFLTNTLIAGQTYTLSGVIGNRADGYGIQLPTDQEYVYLFAGNTLLAKNVNLPHPAPGRFLPWSISYTAPASDPPSGPLEIRLGQYGAGQVHFDNITLTQGQPSSTTLAVSENPSLAGNPVTFTATVSSNICSPTGTIAFFDGTTRLGIVTLGPSGSAILITGTLAAKTHSITAVYSGDNVLGCGTSEVLLQTITNLPSAFSFSSEEAGSNSLLFSESFESPGGGQGTVAGYPTGWLAANLNWWGVYNPLASLYLDFTDDLLPTPAQGSQVLWIQSYNYVARFLTNTLIAGQTYTLSGVIGNRADGYGIQLPTDQEYVYLFAGNTLLAKNVNLPHPAPGHFLPWSISYTAPASDPPSGPLEIRLGQYGAGQVHFDNLSLTAGKTLPPIVAAAPSPLLFKESFESPGREQGIVAGVPDDWLAANLNWWGVYNPLASLYLDFTDDLLPTPAQGSQVLWIQSYNYVARFLTNTLTAGQTYTLSGVIGNRADGYGIQLPTDQEYVYLFAGNTLLAKNVNLPHPAPGYFLPWSISYTVPASDVPAGPLEIRLGQYGAGQVHFDNITLISESIATP